MVRCLFGSAAVLMVVSGASGGAASAQDIPHRRHLRHAQVVVAATGTPTYRGLTVNRPPGVRSSQDGFGDDIYGDGPVRYNDIRDFSPAPYTTSGVQYPYGLDGIGGYGSDLDFGAGQDTAVFDRGAGSGP